MVANYNQALTFAEKYATKEPKKEQALGLVSLIPLEMAATMEELLQRGLHFGMAHLQEPRGLELESERRKQKKKAR